MEDLLGGEPRSTAVRATRRRGWALRPLSPQPGQPVVALGSARLVLGGDVLLADGQVRLVYGEVDVAAADLLARQPRTPVVSLRREQVRLMARVDVLGQVASVDGLLGLTAGARLNQG